MSDTLWVLSSHWIASPLVSIIQLHFFFSWPLPTHFPHLRCSWLLPCIDWSTYEMPRLWGNTRLPASVSLSWALEWFPCSASALLLASYDCLLLFFPSLDWTPWKWQLCPTHVVVPASTHRAQHRIDTQERVSNEPVSEQNWRHYWRAHSQDLRVRDLNLPFALVSETCYVFLFSTC